MIYLAHPFDSRKYIRQWQLEVQSRHDIKFINPFYSRLALEYWIKGDISNDEYYKKIDYKSLVKKDIELIARCDSFLAIIDGNFSIGTIQEIVYANLFKKKVYVICTNKHEKHPWIRFHTNKVFRSLEDFEENIKWIKEK